MKLDLYYVTCLWDDFPEGGTYGTTVWAANDDDAVKEVHAEMAESRASEDCDADYYLKHCSHEWEVIDCMLARDLATNIINELGKGPCG